MSEDIWGAFGLEKPEEGANEQEPAAPATPSTDEGEEAQEVAAPAAADVEGQEEENQEAGEDPPAEPEQTPAEGKKPQTAEERRAAAAARREAERQTLENTIRQQEQEKLSEFLKAMNLRDDKGNAIDSWEKAMTYRQEAAEKKLQSDLKAGRLTKEGLQQILMETPQLKALVDEATEAKKSAQLSDFQSRRELELIEIRKLNPAIQSLDDIVQMDTGARFAELVRKHNLSYLDAYKLANADAMTAKARLAGEQAARNAAAGKGHLRPTTGGQKETITVSRATADMYRRFFPGMSMEEIQKAENSRKRKE